MGRKLLYFGAVLSVLLIMGNYSFSMMCHGGHDKHEEHKKHEKTSDKKTGKLETKESFYSAVYTCPMHPEVQMEKKGKCPKCGMKLEEKQVLLTYACPEKDCDYQKAREGKCSRHDKELKRSQIKQHCPKCGQTVIAEELESKPDKANDVYYTGNAEVNEDMVTCPVMGSKIKKSDAVDSAEYKGQIYYFCCDGCKPEFLKNPDKYDNN